MSARSAYRRKRRVLPPHDFTPFAEELQGHPRLMWASFIGLIATATFVAAFLFLTP